MRPSFRLNPRRLLDNWPFKLAALALATLLWFFVRTDESVTSQRTLNVPLTVIGLDEDELASGVPERVEVTIYGPSTRLDTLRAESVDAFLDLQGVVGNFDVGVSVFPPQGLTSVRTAPSEIIGRVQTRATKRVPVRVALYGSRPEDALVQGTARPQEVIVTGIASQLGRVQSVIAPLSLEAEQVGAESGEGVLVDLYAADAGGQPLSEVRLEPGQVRVSVGRETVLHTRRVPLSLSVPDVSPLEVTAQSLSQPDVLLAGPKGALSALTEVAATVNPPTAPRRPGEYTQGLALQLPGGVRALEAPRVTLQLSRPQARAGGTGGVAAGDRAAPPEAPTAPARQAP